MPSVGGQFGLRRGQLAVDASELRLGVRVLALGACEISCEIGALFVGGLEIRV